MSDQDVGGIPLLQDLDYETEFANAVDYEENGDFSDAQQHWDESLRQLEHAIFYVLCPVVGRVIGRRTAHKLWMSFVNYRFSRHALEFIE